MKSNDFITALEKEFQKNRNPIVAQKQAQYMRNQFAFYGLTADERRRIQTPLFKKYIKSSQFNLEQIVKMLWKKKQRDYQYCAQELTLLNSKKFKTNDVHLFEFMIANKSWWDTIDFLSTKIMGEYFKLYPEKIEEQVEKWIASKNIWLQRSCLLFQLKYKEKLNTQLLSHIIHSLLDSKEFFINKAIGWILREYSKTNKEWVIHFVKKTNLNSLSNREGLKFINKNSHKTQ